jgi:uncharacterized lipoprotein YmbA
MMKRSRPIALVLVLLGALLAEGCSLLRGPDPTPTQFFVLTSRTPRTQAAKQDVSLGVGPLSFPSYLERPQMVSRKQQNQIAVSGSNRWAEPLKDSFLRVLAEDLGKLVGTSEVVMFPWYKTPLTYQIKLEVLRFEPTWEGRAVLQVIWTLYDPKRDRYVVTRHEDFHQSVDSGDPEAVAGAMSELVGQLAAVITKAIRGAK